MDDQDFFLKPKTTAQRRYEALRACYVEGITSSEAARRFGVSPHTVNVWRREFRAGRLVDFFAEKELGRPRRQTAGAAREEIVRLRKMNLSIYEISSELERKGIALTGKTVAQVLDEEGFARLPRRTAGERAMYLSAVAEPAEPTDARLFARVGKVPTAYAGLFFFIPLIRELGVDEVFTSARLYGSKRIPRANYLLSYLALKLLGGKRLSEATALSFDAGLGVFAGLNALPKATALTSYSYRNPHSAIPPMLRELLRSLYSRGLVKGELVNLDFHSIPFWGEESDHLEKHWVPVRGKKMRSVLAFFAQELETTYLFYAGGDVRNEEASDQVLEFARFFKESTGRYPGMLVFDAGLTTMENLRELDNLGIGFLTLRRRGKNLVEGIEEISDWKRYQLTDVKRIYKNPKVHERTASIKGLGRVREIIVTGNGREKPMFMITNNREISAKDALIAYSRRWRIENSLAENVDFFNLNALSSPVIVNVDFDVAMTLFANTLYKYLASKLRYYEHSRAKTLFRNFVEGRAEVSVEEDRVRVRVEKRGRNPMLMELAEAYPDVVVPWWDDRLLAFEFV
jgi:transposase-like protein